MSEISMYEAQKKKMEGLCEEHDLTYRFQKDTYPPTFTISPIQGMDAQLSMLENVEEAGYISPEAKMTWIFKDGSLETKVTGGTFTITKTLRTKIESVLMKMLTYWMQYFFRDVMEKRSLKDGMMPVINEDEVEDDDAYEEDPEDPDDAEAPEMLDGDDTEDAHAAQGVKLPDAFAFLLHNLLLIQCAGRKGPHRFFAYSSFCSSAA